MIKPIPGYKFYSISDDGTVYYKGIEKNVSVNKLGYKKVCICNKGVRVHRLVALTFLGNIEGKVVMHLDDNPSNNHVGNLKIGTHTDNMKDMHSKNRWIYKGRKCMNDAIKNAIHDGLSINNITSQYGVHRNTVLYRRKKLGISSRTKYSIDFITNVIQYEGNNSKTGKFFGLSDMTVMRRRNKYIKR